MLLWRQPSGIARAGLAGLRARPALSAALALSVLSLVFFWRLFTPSALDRGSIPSGDFSIVSYAPSQYLAQRLARGQLPLWSDGAFGGFPFIGDIQNAAFYPPRLLTILLASPWGFPYLALEVEAAAHLALAGIFTFLLARRLIGHTGAAFLAALTFAFGGFLAGYPVQQLVLLEAATWLPLILLCLDHAVCQQRPLNRWTLLAAVAFALSFLAGHPQIPMYGIYLGLAYALWRRPHRRTLLALFVALALAGGLAAVQLLPTLEYARLSGRVASSYDATAAGLPITDVVQILLPGSVSGYSPLYLGMLPLFLVGAALLLKPDRPVRFWFVVALVALVVSWGEQAFLHSLFYLFLPGWRLFRNQERLAVVFALSLSLLAGYGARAVLVPGEVPAEEKRSYARGSLWLVWLLLFAVALFFLGLLAQGWQSSSAFYWLLASASFASIVAALSWGLVRWSAGRPESSVEGRPACLPQQAGGAPLPSRWERGPGGEGLSLALAAALIVFDLFTVGWRHNFSSEPPEAHEQAPGAVQAVRADAAGEPGRVFNEWRLEGNFGLQFGLEELWGASPLHLARYEELLRALPQERQWPLLNVRYAVTWARELSLPSEIIFEEPAAEGETTYVHRLEQPGRRAWLVHRAELVEPEAMVARLSAPELDPWQVALLEEPAALSLSPPAGEESVEITERRPERLAFTVQTGGDALLVLSEVHYPGWQAFVDGRPSPLLRADYVLRAVPVPAGPHTVELVFRPLSLYLGAAVTLLSLAALAVGFVLTRRSGSPDS